MFHITYREFYDAVFTRLVTAMKVKPEPTKKKTKRGRRQLTPRSEHKPNRWAAHVKAFRGQNPNLSFKEVLQKAKDTYTKTVRVKREPGVRKPNPWMLHVAELRESMKSQDIKMSYKEVLQEAKKTYKKNAAAVVVSA